MSSDPIYIARLRKALRLVKDHTWLRTSFLGIPYYRPRTRLEKELSELAWELVDDIETLQTDTDQSGLLGGGK